MGWLWDAIYGPALYPARVHIAGPALASLRLTRLAPHFKELQEKYSNERIETVGPKLRAMFSWNKDGVKDADEANSFTGKIARAQVQ